MLYFLTLLLSTSLYAKTMPETCGEDVKQDVNTPVPINLKDAEIVVRTKDGKEHKISANDFKVVKRKQQFKIKERLVKQPCDPIIIEHEVEKVVVKEDSHKNLLMLSVKNEIDSLEQENNGLTAKVYSKKLLIPEVSYLRRRVLDTPIGLGVGLDVNRHVRLILGVDF